MSYYATELNNMLDEYWDLLPKHIQQEIVSVYAEDLDDANDLELAKDMLQDNIHDDSEYAIDFACELCELFLKSLTK